MQQRAQEESMRSDNYGYYFVTLKLTLVGDDRNESRYTQKSYDL